MVMDASFRTDPGRDLRTSIKAADAITFRRSPTDCSGSIQEVGPLNTKSDRLQIRAVRPLPLKKTLAYLQLF